MGAGAPDCSAGDICVQSESAWTGPVALIVASGAEPATCAGGFATELALLHDGLEADPAVCTCECNAAEVSCSAATLEVHGGESCAANPCDSIVAPSGECWVPSPGCSAVSALLTAEATGTCAPSLSTTLPPVAWAESYRLCSPTDPLATCTGGTCVTPEGEPFSSVACLVAPGDQACPSGFPNRFVGYSSTADSRACEGECSCYLPGCGSVTFFNNSDCTGGSIGSSVPSVCVNFTGSPLSSIRFDAVPGCTAGGEPAATGNVSATEAQTICCI